MILQSEILSNVQDSVVAVDENFNIIYWNKKAEKTLGWSENEVIGRNSSEILQDNIESFSREKGFEKLLSEGHYFGELYYRCKDSVCIPARCECCDFYRFKREFKRRYIFHS